jgi:putative transposase
VQCSVAGAGGHGTVRPMRELLILAIHLLVTFVKLLRPGGLRAVVAESLLLKHQILISNRSRRRAPNDHARSLRARGDHSVPEPTPDSKTWRTRQAGNVVQVPQGVGGAETPPALSSSSQRRKPGPKGPSTELVAAIVEMKRRNPGFGCVRVAQQIAHAFGIEIDKDVVRRVLAQHCHPESGTDSPSWLTFHRAGQGQPLEAGSIPLRS